MARRKVATKRTRGRHFPDCWKLEKLLQTFDPAIGAFEIEMFRRNARDLRKWLEGPSAFYDVPPGQGLYSIELPQGWELILYYHDPGPIGVAAKVTAYFRPPKEEGSQEAPSGSATEPAIAARGELAEETSAMV
jgi:hypothetical protein